MRETSLGTVDFVSTLPLVHKHVKVSVGKLLLETTHPHKHVKLF